MRQKVPIFLHSNIFWIWHQFAPICAQLNALFARHLLGREIEELTGRLEESGNATAAAMEINKKREAELFKLKQELDDANLHHETGLASIRQKHNAIIADLGDQIDQLNKGGDATFESNNRSGYSNSAINESSGWQKVLFHQAVDCKLKTYKTG